MIKMTGTIMNYYHHCPRQCYLFYHRLNMEDQSELVHIGRSLHEIEAEKSKRAEIAIENIKIDKITKDYIVEMKKSDADIEATKWQLYYYLHVLESKGIYKKGKIEFMEAKEKKICIIEMNSTVRKQLKQKIEEIESLLQHPAIPEVKRKKGCTKCAYYEYCFI